MNLKQILPNFGKVATDAVVMTITGALAIKNNAGDYVRFVNDGIEKQAILPNFKVGKFCYNMPVAFSQVQAGDIVKHQDKFLQVIERNEAGQLQAIDLDTCQIILVVPTTIAMFPGMSFVTKVICFMKPEGNVENQSLAGINPMMLMFMGDDNESGEMSDMLPLMLMMGNGENAAGMQQMLPFLLMDSKKSGKTTDSALLMMMMSQGQQGGFTQNSMLPLLMLMKEGKESGTDLKDILMLQMMSGGAQTAGATTGGAASAFNPMMLMLMGDKEGGADMKEIMLMQMMSGGNMFGQAAPAEKKA